MFTLLLAKKRSLPSPTLSKHNLTQRQAKMSPYHSNPDDTNPNSLEPSMSNDNIATQNPYSETSTQPIDNSSLNAQEGVDQHTHNDSNAQASTSDQNATFVRAGRGSLASAAPSSLPTGAPSSLPPMPPRLQCVIKKIHGFRHQLDDLETELGEAWREVLESGTGVQATDPFVHPSSPEPVVPHTNVGDEQFSSSNFSVHGKALPSTWQPAMPSTDMEKEHFSTPLDQSVPSSDGLDISWTTNQFSFPDPFEQPSASKPENGGDQHHQDESKESKGGSDDLMDFLRELKETAASSSEPDFEMPTWADDELWYDEAAMPVVRGSGKGGEGLGVVTGPSDGGDGCQPRDEWRDDESSERSGDDGAKLETVTQASDQHFDEGNGHEPPYTGHEEHHHDESSEPVVGAGGDGTDFPAATQPSDDKEGEQVGPYASTSLELWPTKPLAGNKRKRGHEQDMYVASKRQKNEAEPQGQYTLNSCVGTTKSDLIRNVPDSRAAEPAWSLPSKEKTHASVAVKIPRNDSSRARFTGHCLPKNALPYEPKRPSRLSGLPVPGSINEDSEPQPPYKDPATINREWQYWNAEFPKIYANAQQGLVSFDEYEQSRTKTWRALRDWRHNHHDYLKKIKGDAHNFQKIRSVLNLLSERIDMPPHMLGKRKRSADGDEGRVVGYPEAPKKGEKDEEGRYRRKAMRQLADENKRKRRRRTQAQKRPRVSAASCSARTGMRILDRSSH